MEENEEDEEFDQTMTVTISLDDDDAKGETLDGISFFDIIETPSTSDFLLKVRPEIIIGQLPTSILRVLQTRLNPPAVGTMRNWEHISMLLGMTLDEITLIRSHSNPMEQVLNSLIDVPLNALLVSIADSYRLDLLISLRPHLRNIESNLNKHPPNASPSSFIQAQPGPSKRQITIKLPPKFILVTHHEPPKVKNNQNYHLTTTDSAIDVSSPISSTDQTIDPNRQFKRLWTNLKKWGDTAGIPVFDIDKCIDESNTIASLHEHFQKATQIVLVPSKAYSEEVCSTKMATNSKIDLKKQLEQLMQEEYVHNGMRNERFRVIVIGSQDKVYCPSGWPRSTIVYIFPENHTDIVKSGMNGKHYGEAVVSSLEPKDYPLHRAAFENDVEAVKQILAEGNVDIAKRNAGGDTALHVASMLGHKEIIILLLNADAPVNIKNNGGWSSLVETISYGSREIITEMLNASKKQASAALSARRPHLLKMLSELQDFYIEFKWVFQSWIPFLSRVLPSDVCRIYKKGCKLRMDSSLLDMNDKSLERGNITYLFNPDLPDNNQFVVLDNNLKTYSRLKHDQSNNLELSEEIDVLMMSTHKSKGGRSSRRQDSEPISNPTYNDDYKRLYHYIEQSWSTNYESELHVKAAIEIENSGKWYVTAVYDHCLQDLILAGVANQKATMKKFYKFPIDEYMPAPRKLQKEDLTSIAMVSNNYFDFQQPPDSSVYGKLWLKAPDSKKYFITHCLVRVDIRKISDQALFLSYVSPGELTVYRHILFTGSRFDEVSNEEESKEKFVQYLTYEIYSGAPLEISLVFKKDMGAFMKAVKQSSDIIDASMSTKPIVFTASKVGWVFKRDKAEDVCGYASNFFEVKNLNLITRKRREHLSDEDVKKNKSIMQKFVNGKIDNEEELKWSERRRSSIAPPTRPLISFEEYIASIDPIPLGRQPKVKKSIKAFSAQVAMSQEFPLSVEVLTDILEVLAPTKHMYKLKQFCKSKLPPGFPVELEIPIFATISAKVTFQKFEWRDDLRDQFFTIPHYYKKKNRTSLTVS